MRNIVIGVIALLIIGLLGAGGYFFAYPLLKEQAEANSKEFEGTGAVLMTNEIYQETQGTLGAKQVPATFAEDVLSPSQRVIKGLKEDREELILDQKKLERRIDELKVEIQNLEEYKATNERFAPLNAVEEKAIVESLVKRFLIDDEDAVRFSNMQIEIMGASAANEYSTFTGRNRLILTDEERVKMVREHLLPFAFCVGDGVDIAANNNRELRAVSYLVRSGDNSQITPILLQDLNAVMKPCRTELFASLSTTLDKG
ncbi:MAG: hypothetical protein OIF57_02200 [Marinobacterium sp.]|nr:hypothetical protein [Marinobacterium sp.]